MYCLNASELLWLHRIESIIIPIVDHVKKEFDGRFDPGGQ